MTTRVISVIRRLRRCERGATALEYAFIAGLISIAAIAGFSATGTSLKNIYGALSADVENAVS